MSKQKRIGKCPLSLTPYISLLLVLVFGLHLSAQEGPELKRLDQLPSHVKTKASEIGVFADWKNVTDSKVTVYIVNWSKKSVKLQHAYGRCYLKMEAQTENNQWERVESQAQELCGTGLGEFELKANHWFSQTHFVVLPKAVAKKNAPIKGVGHEADSAALEKIAAFKQEIADIKDFMKRARLTQQGYEERIAKIKSLEGQVAAAEAAFAKQKAQAKSANVVEHAAENADEQSESVRTVRLRIYDNHCRSYSNIGKAVINPEAAKGAKRDAFAIQFADLETLRGIINGKLEFKPMDEGPMTIKPKQFAISALAGFWHPAKERMAILNEVIAGDDEYLASIAKSVVAALDKKK